MSEESIIEKLALTYGIESEYVDNWGHVHPTSLETKKQILHAMGVCVDAPECADSALRDLLNIEPRKRAHAAFARTSYSAFARTSHAAFARTSYSAFARTSYSPLVLPDGSAARAAGRLQSSHLAEPSIVARIDKPPAELIFQIPMETKLEDMIVELTITSEEGRTVQQLSYTRDNLCVVKRIQGAQTTFLRCSIPFPKLRELGYYRFRLHICAGDWRAFETIFVAICPDKSYMPATLQDGAGMAGISLSLYSVRSDNNWGVGDFGDLKRIVKWVSEDLCGNLIGLNPLHATYNRSPFNVSPYLPISKFYRNYIYLDIPSMEDYGPCEEAQRVVESIETRKLLAHLRSSRRVQYEKVAALKIRVLRLVFDSFLKSHWHGEGKKTARGHELRQYIETGGRFLKNFATFCALDTAMHASDPTIWTWPQWPQEYRRPDTAEVRRFSTDHSKEILFYMYVQWQIEKQLKEVQDHAKNLGMCIGMYHDLALAIDRFGADFWAYQDSFWPNLRVGAPPDAFSQHGQDWGFAPPRIDRLRQDGYELLVQEIRRNCAFGGALRIDHAMRFFHLYCIPEGMRPSEGAYVSQPYEDFIGILALESVRNKVVIIGEDLGTVPPLVRQKLSDANVFSYRLLYFEKDDHNDFIPPEDYPELALVTISTHDLPTFVGFWNNEDIGIRERSGLFNGREAVIEALKARRDEKGKLLTLLNDLGLLIENPSSEPGQFPDVTGDLHNAVVGFLALTPCKLFVLSQEDLFKDGNQQNLPGTTHEYPNWSLKMKYSVEELFNLPEAKAFASMFRAWVDRSGRTNKPQHKGGRL